MNKSVYYIAASIGGIIGSYAGSLLDNGNLFGIWAILLSTVGGVLGIYVMYKIQN